MIIRRLV